MVSSPSFSTAADRFFKPENLTALRELALRRAAQTVDDQLQGEMRRAGAELRVIGELVAQTEGLSLGEVDKVSLKDDPDFF